MDRLYAPPDGDGKQERKPTDVALLIDWENLKISLRRNFGVSPLYVARASAPAEQEGCPGQGERARRSGQRRGR